MGGRKNGSTVEPSRAGIRTDQWRVARAFGIALRAARERRDLSPEQLADRSGLDCGYPSLLERGLHVPSLSDFLRLSVAAGVAPARLLEDTVVAYAGQALARTDVIRLREIWMAFARTLAKSPQDEPLLATVLAVRLLDELARHGLTVVSLPFEPREHHGHA